MIWFRARGLGLAVLLIAACVDRPGPNQKTGALKQAETGSITPIQCPPNAYHQLESPDGGPDAGAEPASNFDTCSWAGWSPLTFQAEDGEFFVVGGADPDYPAAGEEELATELAQTIHPWAQNAKPGTVGIIVHLARNTSSDFSTNALLIDLVGPLNSPDGGVPDIATLTQTRVTPPLSYVGQTIVDNGTETSAPLLATGRFDTSALEVGIDTTIEVALYPNTPICTMAEGPDEGTSACNVAAGSSCDPATCDSSGVCRCTPPLINYADAGAGVDAGIVYNEYALVFHMEGPANNILLAGNDGTPSLIDSPTYVLNCPEPGVPECDGAAAGVYLTDGGIGFDGSPSSVPLPLGLVFIRQEFYEPVFNPVTMETEADLISAPWIANANVSMNFYMTVNDGPPQDNDAGAAP